MTVTLSTGTLSDISSTCNALADSKRSDKNKVVVIGAHLDSVPAGPGINDNGSGTATILKTAIQMSRLGIKPRQKLRLASWVAEKAELLGSQICVDDLSDTELATYANLDFDMLGSPVSLLVPTGIPIEVTSVGRSVFR